MIILFIREVNNQLITKIRSDMKLDINNGTERIDINLNITVERIPCSIIQLDFQDILGNEAEYPNAVVGTALKITLNKNGQQLSIEKYDNITKLTSKVANEELQSSSPLIKIPKYEEVKKEFEDGNGCRIVGDLSVMKVTNKI